MELTLAIRTEGDGYRADVLELAGCVACAQTFAELADVLEQSVAIWLDDPDLTLLYLDLHVGQVVVSAVPGVLHLWPANVRSRR